jgi:hypothetical protein
VRMKRRMLALALVLVAGMATFLPSAMGGQGRALPVQAKLMSDSVISMQGDPLMPQDPITNRAIAYAPAGDYQGAYGMLNAITGYVGGKFADVFLGGVVRTSPSESQLAALSPSGDSRFNAAK